jgi:hypothetical protein
VAIADCKAKRCEGVAIKHRTAPYRPGESGQHFKFKFTKSASCKVTAVGVDSKCNAAIGLRDAKGKWIEVAHVSTIGKCRIAPGQIVEILFLYATEGNRLYQPRIKEVRTDVPDSECTFARQLKPTQF